MTAVPTATPLPARIGDEAHLEDLLSVPSAAAIETLRELPGDVVLLGVAGKMGPTLARMVRRAAEAAGTARRVIGVSRFSEAGPEAALQEHGVETIRCDLLDEAAVERLPDAPLVIYMAGRKFGSSGDESLTWAMNTWLPGVVARRYAGSRIAAFSTGNVYGLTRVGHGGSRETDLPSPVGEYAMSCLGRERIFEHASRSRQTPLALLRLNYATEMRYGLLVDLARRIAAGETIDLTMGHANVIWQGDANAMAIASLRHAASPPFVVNLAGPEELSVREVCRALGQRMGLDVTFTGEEAGDALLSNGQRGWDLLGAPTVPLARLLDWTADWVRAGGASLGKPTHFESRDGKF